LRGSDEYIVVESAITTPKAYSRFEASYAHIFDDQVVRYGDVIGTTADIQVIGLDETQIESFDGIDDPSWRIA
jgi:hypothetical protein